MFRKVLGAEGVYQGGKGAQWRKSALADGECFITDIVWNCQHMVVRKSRLVFLAFIIVFKISINRATPYCLDPKQLLPLPHPLPYVMEGHRGIPQNGVGRRPS